MTPLVPKPLTSNSKADGRFDKRDFVYIAAADEYRCPAGQRAIKRFTTIERGMTLHKYWSSACPRCPLKAQCTSSDYRRIARWEHEAVLEAMQERLDRQPDAMRLRRQTVEHPFGTLKAWMGATLRQRCRAGCGCRARRQMLPLLASLPLRGKALLGHIVRNSQAF